MARRIPSAIAGLLLCFSLLPTQALAEQASQAQADTPPADITVVVDQEPDNDPIVVEPQDELPATNDAEASTPLLAAQFSADNYRTIISQVDIGAPTAASDGGRYLPVHIHFYAPDNIVDPYLVYFLEGHTNVNLSNGGTAEGIQGLSPTLMGPVALGTIPEDGSYSWDWQDGVGTGEAVYHIPMLDSNDTQAVEKSQATGTYKVVVTGVGNCRGTKTKTFKITKAKNKAVAKKTTVKKTIKAATLEKKAVGVTLPKVTTKFGTAKWKVVAKDKKNVLSLRGKKIKVKKGAKKGTYVIKLRASVAKTANYGSASTKTVKVYVTVK